MQHADGRRAQRGAPVVHFGGMVYLMPLQILEAVSRKVAVSPTVDLDAVARDTEGFSGADLQALVYNAQLEVIHETIAASSDAGNSNTAKEDDDQPIEYTIVGGLPGEKTVKSRAEEAAFQRRVRLLVCRAWGEHC